MRFVDLSREIAHQEPGNAGAVPTQVWPWRTHEQTRQQYTTGYSYANRLLTMHDHASTHVDATFHFTPAPDGLDIASMPLERFYGPALCLDVTRTADPEWVDVGDLEAACAKDNLPIQPNDIVLLNSGHFRRHYPRPEFFTRYPGLTEAAVWWLHERGVRNFGVEGPNPGHPADRNFEVHVICRQTGMIHIENLANLEAVVGRRFTFAGFPLRIRDGTGSPIRAVALLE